MTSDHPAPRRHRPGADHPAQDITDPATGGSRLLSERCATCIFHPGDRMYLGPGRFRQLIAEALRAGSYVICHDTLSYGDHPEFGPAICRGFYDAYANRSFALRLLRACGRLTEVPPPAEDPPPPPGSQ